MLISTEDSLRLKQAVMQAVKTTAWEDRRNLSLVLRFTDLENPGTIEVFFGEAAEWNEVAVPQAHVDRLPIEAVFKARLTLRELRMEARCHRLIA